MNTAYMQQETILKKNGIAKSPQVIFIEDMTKFIEKLTAEDHEIQHFDSR